MMKKLFLKWKWLPIVLGVLFMVVGLTIAICVWIPQNNTGDSSVPVEVKYKIDEALGYIIASLIMAVGLGTLTLSLFQKPMKLDFTFFISVTLASLSGFIFYLLNKNQSLVTNIVIIQAAIFIFSIALFLIIWGLRKILSRSKKILFPVLAFIAAAILVAAGITILVLMENNRVIQQLAICAVGVAITAIGLYVLFYFFKQIKGKSLEKAEEQTISNEPVKTEETPTSKKKDVEEEENEVDDRGSVELDDEDQDEDQDDDEELEIEEEEE